MVHVMGSMVWILALITGSNIYLYTLLRGVFWLHGLAHMMEWLPWQPWWNGFHDNQEVQYMWPFQIGAVHKSRHAAGVGGSWSECDKQWWRYGEKRDRGVGGLLKICHICMTWSIDGPMGKRFIYIPIIKCWHAPKICILHLKVT